MFRLDVLQNQWLALSLAAGLIVTLCLTLYCLAMWKERPGATAPEPEERPDGKPRRWSPPALLVLVYVGVLIFGIVYTAMMVWNPPNW